MRTLPIDGHIGIVYSVAVYSVAFNPADGNVLASGSSDGIVRLWNVPTKQLTTSLDDQTAGIESVAFTRDGKIQGSAGEDKTVRLWNVG